MDTSVVYDNDEEFPIGGCKVLRISDSDRAMIVASGVTLYEPLVACD